MAEIAGFKALASQLPVIEIMREYMDKLELLIGLDLHLVGDDAALDARLGHRKDKILEHEAGFTGAGEAAEHSQIAFGNAQGSIIHARAVFAVRKPLGCALVQLGNERVIAVDILDFHILGSADADFIEFQIKVIIDIGTGAVIELGDIAE